MLTACVTSLPAKTPPTPALMFQGTGSDVGKSLVVAGLCRAFHRRGLRVLPFKPQNMSNNAAVTDDGGEIGRAQALQAQACKVRPHSDMNPVLLKPQSERGSQVVVQGKVLTQAEARDYYRLKPTLMPRVLESYHRLAAQADLMIIEGAGSAAEVNLRAADIANMGFAEAADVPVLLVGDIDRGGVIASLVGTYALLSDSEKRRLKGYVINKFRGDPSLFHPALAIIEERTGLVSHGILPWWSGAHRLPAEDGASLKTGKATSQNPAQDQPIRIRIPRLPHIANFDDFDPLAAEPDVDLAFVGAGSPLPLCDLILLPGSKSTLDDLAFLKAQGWDIDLKAHVRQGGYLLGICAGYQMMGLEVSDPQGVEGPAGRTEQGLGLLNLTTIMAGRKMLRETAGQDHQGYPVHGYEMHMGTTEGPARLRPYLHLTEGPDGAMDETGRVAGCYLHGLFAADKFRAAFLGQFRADRPKNQDYAASVEQALDDLADQMERHLDLDGLLALARAPLATAHGTEKDHGS